MTHAGSCLCGAVTFSIEGTFDRFFLCHCARCRKDTGSAHAANLFASTATIAWLSGRDEVRAYTLPQTRHVHAFCGVCGSAMPYAMDGLVVVPAGCLDTPLAAQPDAHILVASRATWDKGLDGIAAFDGFPP